jgi:hypothetical protein
VSAPAIDEIVLAVMADFAFDRYRAVSLLSELYT